MDRYSLAIIIPAFNESNTITNVVENCRKYGEVIVINDGSNDNTGLKAAKCGAIVLSHDFPKGYDKAINTGFNYAIRGNYQYLLTLDADGQHDPKEIPLIVKKLELGADLVVGNRNKKARIAEYLFSFYTSLLWNISDPLSGFKAYKIKLCKKIGYFDSYDSIGTEILLFALKNGMKVLEHDIKTKQRNGKSRFGSFLKANFKIIRSLTLSFSKKYN